MTNFPQAKLFLTFFSNIHFSYLISFFYSLWASNNLILTADPLPSDEPKLRTISSTSTMVLVSFLFLISSWVNLGNNS